MFQSRSQNNDLKQPWFYLKSATERSNIRLRTSAVEPITCQDEQKARHYIVPLLITG